MCAFPEVNQLADEAVVTLARSAEAVQLVLGGIPDADGRANGSGDNHTPPFLKSPKTGHDRLVLL